ncbi:MAG: hypothetical protein H0X27_07195 [Caulobacteraceae bacterium]|nr:hypothetical protein [Caulobacteraceae bacterium]
MLLQLLTAAATALSPAPAAGQGSGAISSVAARTVPTTPAGQVPDLAGEAGELARPRPGFVLLCGPVPDRLRDIGWQHGRCLDAGAPALAWLAPPPRSALSTGVIFL